MSDDNVQPAMSPAMTVSDALRFIRNSKLNIAGLGGDHHPPGAETEYLELQRVRGLFKEVSVKHAIVLLYQFFSDETSSFSVILPNGKAVIDCDANYVADLTMWLGDFVRRAQGIFGSGSLTHKLGEHLVAAE